MSKALYSAAHFFGFFLEVSSSPFLNEGEIMWRKPAEQGKKAPGCLGYRGDEILPSYVRIIIKHYTDPYSTTSIMESI